MPIARQELSNMIVEGFNAALPESLPQEYRASIEAGHRTIADGIASAVEGYVVGKQAQLRIDGEEVRELMQKMLFSKMGASKLTISRETPYMIYETTNRSWFKFGNMNALIRYAQVEDMTATITVE